MLREVAAELLALPSLQPLLEGLKVKSRYQLVYGLDESARTMLMAALRLHTDRPVLIVTPDQTHAGRIYEDMLSVFKDEDVYLFPGKELLYYSNLFSESGDAAAQRNSCHETSWPVGDNIVVGGQPCPPMGNQDGLPFCTPGQGGLCFHFTPPMNEYPHLMEFAWERLGGMGRYMNGVGKWV
ncbi:DEAD/DEAH box helicase family protein [Dethiobacter alkaliphilus]|uniref:Transcription-repair coupling factor n=1 Tax=Dethiobacter alkaliphilus AHT 1 TaxID=555088 RepID=C0GJD6_DETAL|nr:hypothetical protein [Dethiobacter alkaliphilus]EEG76621.1 hypothetical protein DealDRAFT_2595 [Dethiobacter alkaliphilus AHT 1]